MPRRHACPHRVDVLLSGIGVFLQDALLGNRLRGQGGVCGRTRGLEIVEFHGNSSVRQPAANARKERIAVPAGYFLTSRMWRRPGCLRAATNVVVLDYAVGATNAATAGTSRRGGKASGPRTHRQPHRHPAPSPIAVDGAARVHVPRSSVRRTPCFRNCSRWSQALG